MADMTQEITAEAEKETTSASAAPAKKEWDGMAAIEKLQSDYYDIDFDEDALLDAASKGEEAFRSFEFGLKAATISFNKKGRTAESRNPMVALRNTSVEDCNIASQRYAEDYDDVFQDGDETVKVAREARELVMDDPLAKEGMTSLAIKGKSKDHPEGTYLVCRESLAELIKLRSGMGDNLSIEEYDPKRHRERAVSKTTLMEDPSIAHLRTDAEKEHADDLEKLNPKDKAGWGSGARFEKMGPKDISTGETVGPPSEDFQTTIPGSRRDLKP